VNVHPTDHPDIVLLEPSVFRDERGFFLESYNAQTLEKILGRSIAFVQDNHSRSGKNVLRGLHYQLTQPQEKLVRVVSGAVYSVAVDIRKSSPRFGSWAGVELTAENRRQLFIPAGFAHGFLVLSDTADFLYKTSAYYAPQDEHRIIWNDPDLAIGWPLPDGSLPILSEKDAGAPMVRDVPKETLFE
jgi:dTDP-4-dehydrorhamnose 3,5-epimerase